MQPAGEKIQAFGSRVTGFGAQLHSDIDLLVVTPDKLPLLLQGDLRAAQVDSDLPFSVDIVEAQDTEPEFLASLKEIGPVELCLLRDIT